MPEKKITQTCPHCQYQFSAADIDGFVFCPACGKRFSVVVDTGETAIIEMDVGKNDLVSSLGQTIDVDEMDLSAALLSTQIKNSETIGNYDIISEIARGGVGVVYQARHRFLNRVVALKVLRAGASATTEDVARFMQEAKAVASLSHPNIVPIHEFNVERGQYYYTMNYIEGASLDRVLERERLSPYRACEIIVSVARAIHYAHTRGIIHRDLKPANIMITEEGRPMITDFGLAVNISNDRLLERMTRSGAVMGTIPYIPPEQAAGKIAQISPRSDVYSLGAMFYEMLTGRPPFTGLTQYELLQRVINRSPIEPRKLNPRIAPDLQTICLKCLEKEPTQRYLTALALADECHAFLNGEPISARRHTWLHKTKRIIRRYPTYCALVVLAAMLMFSALVLRSRLNRSQHELSNVVHEHGQVMEEKRRLDTRIERAWRRDFSLQVGKNANLSANKSVALNRQFCWYNRIAATPTEKSLQLFSLDDHRFSAFGVPVNLPERYQIDCALISTEQIAGDGYVELLFHTDRDFRADRPSVLSLRLGAANAKLVNNEITLAENNSFHLEPQKTYLLTITENVSDDLKENRGRTLTVTINSERLFTVDIPSSMPTQPERYFAMVSRGPTIDIEKLAISIPGLNQEMITSLLELGDGLATTADEKNLARLLYRRVLQERVPVSVILRVYFGFAKTALSERVSRDETLIEIKSAYEKMTENLQHWRGERNYTGEIAYGYGLVLATLHAHREAIQQFRTAYKEAEGAEKNFLPPTRAVWVVAAPNNSPAQTPTIFDPSASYFDARSNQSDTWHTLPLSDDNHYELPALSFINNELARYLLVAFESRGESYLLSYPPNTKIWINGTAHPVNKRGEQITAMFKEGENLVLLQLPLNMNNLSLTVSGKKEINVFGLLARLDEAVSMLHTNNYREALPLFLRLRDDNIVQTLRERYPTTAQIRNYFSTIFPALDRLLATAGRSPVKLPSYELNLAVRVLDTLSQLGANEPLWRRELARRYDEAANIYLMAALRPVDRTVALYNADRLLEIAQRTAVDWYIPRLIQAEFFYQQAESRAAAYSAFAALRDNFRERVDLRQDLAEFLLQPNKHDYSTDQKILPEPQLALAVLDETLKLPNGRDATTLELYTRALWSLKKYDEALKYADETQKLANTPEIRVLIEKIRAEKNGRL